MSEALLTFEESLEKFDPAMGLEVHVELNTASKMFCGCPTEFGAEPNTQVCPTCLGLPGAMPVVNRVAVESAMRIGLALNCEIAQWCRFARKNYFYPDMPKNFQTSQYDEPIAFEGWTEVEVEGRTYRVEIERAHMEEDTGKSLHVGGATGRIHGADYSLLDYNRAGIPLIEIVTRPIVVPGDRAPLGELLAASHRSLAEDFEVSTPELDQLVAAALATPGVVGSRMTGAGFGGCTVSLVEVDRAEAVREEVCRRYAEASGRSPRGWVSRAADGASVV